MTRPSHLEILEYALDGARTYRGIYAGQMCDEEEDEVDNHITWLGKAIARRKIVDARARARNAIALAKDLNERRPK